MPCNYEIRKAIRGNNDGPMSQDARTMQNVSQLDHKTEGSAVIIDNSSMISPNKKDGVDY